MTVTVTIPTALRGYTKGNSEVVLAVSSVEEILLKLNERFPGFWSMVVDEDGNLRKYVNIFVNQEDIRRQTGLATKLKAGDRVHMIPSVAGGV